MCSYELHDFKTANPARCEGCHTPIWHKIEFKSSFSQGWPSLNLVEIKILVALLALSLLFNALIT
jgi:hypothetical protein